MSQFKKKTTMISKSVIGRRKHLSRNGGVGIRIVWIIISLCIIATAIVLLFHVHQNDEERNIRKAMEISEYGLLNVLELLGTKPSWTEGFSKTSYNGGWYSAKLTRREKGDTVLLYVETTGHIGTVSKKQECVLRLTIMENDSSWVRCNIQ